MGIFSKFFGSQDPESQKNQKFRELEKQFGKDSIWNAPEMINFAKAAWLTSRGNYFGSQNQLDLAIKDFKEAIALEPNHAPAHISLGIAYRAKGIFEKAIEVLENAPQKSKLDGKETADARFGIFLNLGLVYMDMGDKKKAVDYLEKALKINGFLTRDPEMIRQQEILKEIGTVDVSTEQEHEKMIENIKKLLAELKE